jgi:twinkle protein
MNLICNQYAEHGTKSFLFIPENERQIKDRLSLIWGSRQGWDAFAEVGAVIGSAIRREDQSPRSLDWILAKAVDCHNDGHGGLVILDPWNEIDFTRPKDVPQTEFIGWCLRDITQFARETNLTVILSAHPTKSGVAEGKIPGPYDLADSAHFANKPDNILCVFRDPVQKGVTSIISQKVREIGAGKRGLCVFNVDEETGIFTPQHGAVTP